MNITRDQAIALLDKHNFTEVKKCKRYIKYKCDFGKILIYKGDVYFSIEAYHDEWTIRQKTYTAKTFEALLKKMLAADKEALIAKRDYEATVAVHKKFLEDTIASCEEAKKYPYTLNDVEYKSFIHAEIKVGKICLNLFPGLKGMVKINFSTEEIKVPLSKAIRIAEIMNE